MGRARCCCAAWLVVVLVAMSAFVITFLLVVELTPVEVTVDEASLGRLSLANTSGNGNATAPSFLLSYNLSLAVAVHNPSWSTRAWRTSPLDAELRFRGRPFAAVRMGTAGEWGRIRALRTEVHRVASAAERAPVDLGSFEVAEFDRERVAGEFGLELVVAGEFKYQAHSGRRRIKVSCPLRLSLLPTSAAFERVECTEECRDDDDD
ncbi:hypothetical protein HU200_004102 [Digitaria exilis]|uniref:Late embryogenesis abundant protein LEA-2 subgroup domain-containing protein n=1 Tax=Digitaria exilis TaxID=1010633 RepID=A0A835FT54_9POAL|nr:hypothetical protein HU200_004102 [Digitaria exilis]CAB3447889.1 unnamed protein product [Digitaria exilis]